MENTKQKVYKFHCKIDEEMQTSLNNLPLFKQAGNLSHLIIRILTLLSPIMEQKHLENEQMWSKYAFINDNEKISRKSMYVYLPDYLYRKLKLMHQDLNCYSIAQLLRWVIRVFLELVKLYGDQVESKLMAVYLKWKAEKVKRKYEYKPVEELLHFIYQKPRISSFLTLYSKKFQPINIYRL